MLPGQSEITPLQVATAIAGGTIALIVLGIQPVLYGAYVLEGSISPQRLGLLSAVEIAGIAAGSAIGVQLLARWRTQILVLAATALLIAGNLIPVAEGATGLLMLCRLTAGIGGGLLVGIVGVAISRTRRLGAWAGSFVLTQGLVPYLVLRGFMHFDPDPASHTVQLVLAGFGLMTLLLLPLYPARMLGSGDEQAEPIGRPQGRGIVGLGSVLLCVGAVGGIWGYLEVWMHSRGIERVDSTSLITISLLGQILGAVAGSLIADGKWGWLRLIVLLCALMSAVVAWLAWPSSAVVSFGYGVAYAMVAPAFPPLLARLDPVGRAVPYSATAQLVGLAILPTLAGEFLAQLGLDLVLVGFLSCMLGSLVLVLSQVPFLLGRNRKSDPVYWKEHHEAV